MSSYENHTVILDCGTIGKVSRSSIDYNDIHDLIGEKIEVVYHDDGGSPVRKTGEVCEVLEVAYLDQQ